MDVNKFNSTVEWAKKVAQMAKDKMARGVDPLTVHEWLMRQGFSIEEADRITGCKTS